MRGPAREQSLDAPRLLRELGDPSLDACWSRLRARPFLVPPIDGEALERVAPGEARRVAAAAGRAARREVDVIGTGPFTLGRPADWSADVKTGTTWPPAWWRELDYAQLDRPSDVKVPWEVSRLQWLLPLGQAYLLDGDDRHAAAARDVLDEWIAANPYGSTVNWASPMEAALRILTFTWLFHALGGSSEWVDAGFRLRFLRAVYLHGDFVARNLELSDVNGNHLDADAAGLVVCGLFLGSGGAAARWERRGWTLLLRELPRQVAPDGVDFEMSTGYHRLVTELFLLPALLRRAQGLDVPTWYLDRLGAMGTFAATYTRPDGTSPVWGDTDDARALPLGGQALGDHRYLATIMAAAWNADVPVSGPRSEAAWLVGADAALRLADTADPPSRVFRDGGAAVLRSGSDHVFVDCGPVGLAGRGGHGHNDCLSFDAMLAGVHLVADPGSFVYTASVEWRNRFRSTSSHNTPIVDGAEQNRPTDPPSLWLMRADTFPELREIVGDPPTAVRVAHTGYRRLDPPVTPVRRISLELAAHRLVVADEFEGSGEHDVRVPLHLAPGVTPRLERDALVLSTPTVSFSLTWSEADWEVSLGEGWFSPSYGVRVPISRVEFRRTGPLLPLTIALEPQLR